MDNESTLHIDIIQHLKDIGMKYVLVHSIHYCTQIDAFCSDKTPEKIIEYAAEMFHAYPEVIYIDKYIKFIQEYSIPGPNIYVLRLTKTWKEGEKYFNLERGMIYYNE